MKDWYCMWKRGAFKSILGSYEYAWVHRQLVAGDKDPDIRKNGILVLYDGYTKNMNIRRSMQTSI